MIYGYENERKIDFVYDYGVFKSIWNSLDLLQVYFNFTKGNAKEEN